MTSAWPGSRARSRFGAEGPGRRHMRPEAAYQELIELTRRGARLASCLELLAWDELTYLPPAGVTHRANQSALLTGLHHACVTDPRNGALLDELESSDLALDPLSPEAVNI